MMKFKAIIYLVLLSAFLKAENISIYNPIWTTQSKNSSESMPCGGGDIGLNVWVENGDLLFYMAQSGTFDENNTMPKLGRVRLHLEPNPFNSNDFKQELILKHGYISIKGKNANLSAKIKVWVDVFHPIIHVEVEASQPIVSKATYESWRYQNRLIRKMEGFQNSYKWAPPKGLTTKKDSISFRNNSVLFYHQNKGATVFDATVKQQGMEAVKDSLFNPLNNLIFGGLMSGDNMVASGTDTATYLTTDFKGWHLKSIKPLKKHHVQVVLNTGNFNTSDTWLASLKQQTSQVKVQKQRKATLAWWQQFWQRSYININSHTSDTSSVAWKVGRNYQLFRYMLGCNAYGKYPTKFNGGLFTYDPKFVNAERAFTPDFRNWSGGTFTAQNQRLVYFPMFKSGDFDMIPPQIEFYNRLLKNAEIRSKFYWNHSGACFTEQLENFGLPNPSEYGWKRPDDYDKGMQYNAWLEYQWDTSLEICYMALQLYHYNKEDIKAYLPLIESSLTFFDEHYRLLARQRGRKELDGDGHLVLYPGSSCETYKMAYNATSTVVALKTVLSGMLQLPNGYLSDKSKAALTAMKEAIPPIAFREMEGKKTIAPAKLWERINNTEVPQLYPVYPWGVYGVGKPDLEIAQNTYLYDTDAIKFRGHKSWKQDNIFAARLGFVDEAKRLSILKLNDSGRRFPAFWGPGFDWVPDHNWGGSGMIGLQEMLLQTDGDRILLFPAWPKEWDVEFKLHAPQQTTVEGILKDGKIISIKVTPEARKKDVEIFLNGLQ